MDLARIRQAVSAGQVLWQRHALERMLERGIARDDVIQAILHGDVIETYPGDYPFPSCLIFFQGDTPLHVVLSYNDILQTIYLITAYIPDTTHFESDLKTRRNV
jgi:hypothetical protein